MTFKVVKGALDERGRLTVPCTSFGGVSVDSIAVKEDEAVVTYHLRWTLNTATLRSLQSACRDEVPVLLARGDTTFDVPRGDAHLDKSEAHFHSSGGKWTLQGHDAPGRGRLMR